MKIERPFHKYKRHLTLAMVLFFSSIIVVGFLFTFPFFEEWVDKAVYQPWFGRFFVWAHLIIIGIIITFVTIYMILAKRTLFFGPAFKFFQTWEVKKFALNYPYIPKTTLLPKGTRWLTLIMILSTFLPVFLGFLLWKLEVHEAGWYLWLNSRIKISNWYIYLLAIPMFIVFYGAAYKIMKNNKKEWAHLLDYINQSVNDTQLKLGNDGLSIRKMKYSTKVEGKFKGRKVSADANITRAGSISTSTAIAVSTKSKLNFELKERKINWRSFEAESVDDIFERRFVLEGIDQSNLPIEFKDWAIHCLRPIHLLLAGGELVYSLKNTEILPFHCFEGMVVMFDELIQVADWLERKKALGANIERLK